MPLCNWALIWSTQEVVAKLQSFIRHQEKVPKVKTRTFQGEFLSATLCMCSCPMRRWSRRPWTRQSRMWRASKPAD